MHISLTLNKFKCIKFSTHKLEIETDDFIRDFLLFLGYVSCEFATLNRTINPHSLDSHYLILIRYLKLKAMKFHSFSISLPHLKIALILIGYKLPRY